MHLLQRSIATEFAMTKMKLTKRREHALEKAPTTEDSSSTPETSSSEDDGPFTQAIPTKRKVTGATEGEPREKSWEAPVEEAATRVPKKGRKKKKTPEEESTSKPKKKKKVTQKEARHSNIEADAACCKEKMRACKLEE